MRGERRKEGGREAVKEKFRNDDTHVLLVLHKIPSKTKEGNKLDQAPDLKQTSPHPKDFIPGFGIKVEKKAPASVCHYGNCSQEWPHWGFPAILKTDDPRSTHRNVTV